MTTDSPAGSPWAGIWIAEDIEQLAEGVESGNWIDSSLALIGAGLDGLALMSDPLGGLLQYGIAWLIEHVKPLAEALDWLAGDPAQVTANATAWRNTASSLSAEAATLRRTLETDVPDWTGAAFEAYALHATHQAQALEALSTAANTTASMTEVAGILVGSVRMMVRDAVATVVSRLISYAVELTATLGVGTPAVVEQVTTLCAAWAGKIARWLNWLLASLGRLEEMSGRLSRTVDNLGGMGKGGSNAPEPLRETPPDPTRQPADPPDFSIAEPDPRKIAGYAMNPDHRWGRTNITSYGPLPAWTLWRLSNNRSGTGSGAVRRSRGRSISMVKGGRWMYR
nr:hypothetical protein [Actinoplanes sp. TFC3]